MTTPVRGDQRDLRRPVASDGPVPGHRERMTTPHGDERIVGIVRDFNFDPLTKPVTPFVFDMQDPHAVDPLPLPAPGAGERGRHLSAIQARWGSSRASSRSSIGSWTASCRSSTRPRAPWRGWGHLLRAGRVHRLPGPVRVGQLDRREAHPRIGVRKVLGAGTGRIAMLVMRDLLVLVLVASVIAVPLAWTGVARWLQQFAFRTPLDPLVFAGALLLVFAVATITVGPAPAGRTDRSGGGRSGTNDPARRGVVWWPDAHRLHRLRHRAQPEGLQRALALPEGQPTVCRPVRMRVRGHDQQDAGGTLRAAQRADTAMRRAGTSAPAS